MIIIRPERPEHAAGVYQVEKAAFGRPAEADLCQRLRKRKAVTVSLVALDADHVVGHVLFSPVRIAAEGGGAEDGGGTEDLPVVGMGPVAVNPDHQRQGIGSRLIRAGLEEVRQLGVAAVVVLGDPRYYTRFGFQPAARYGVRFQDPSVPAEDFMLIELRRGALEGHGGVATYEPEFLEV